MLNLSKLEVHEIDGSSGYSGLQGDEMTTMIKRYAVAVQNSQ